MAVAPVEAAAAEAFGVLRELSRALQESYPGAVVVSAGMSGDLEAAIATGSTCVRVGTALFGRREHVLD
jgi:uncharacterized pyridoxal phosphate-containing UPF0001 family protein